MEEEDKKKKRMERFGLGVTEVSTDVSYNFNESTAGVMPRWRH